MQASTAAEQALRQWCAGERCSADWILIDQARISAFAEVTEDRYWLHTQPDRARAQAPFGGSIAHGFLLLSLTVGDDVVELGALPGVVQVLNYGLDKVRFLAPVCARGQRARAQPGGIDGPEASRSMAAAADQDRAGQGPAAHRPGRRAIGPGDPALTVQTSAKGSD